MQRSSVPLINEFICVFLLYLNYFKIIAMLIDTVMWYLIDFVMIECTVKY